MIERPERASGWKKNWQKQQWQGHCTEMQIWKAGNEAGYKEFNKPEWILPEQQWKTPILPEKAQVSRNTFF